MNIAQMRVAIRPMSTAQAIDLGMMMARHWYVPLWKIWVGMALPVFMISSIGLSIIEAQTGATVGWLGGLIFWWLKPIYEKPMLTWLSQALFADHQDIAESIKKGWQESRYFAGSLLLRYRLSPQRQLIMPIALLERPNKAQFKERLIILSRGQGGGLTWHTLVLVHIESLIAIAMAIVLWQLIPTSLMSGDAFFEYIEQAPFWFNIIWSLFYFIAISIVAPFFIAGGFAVYLTKRCLLEGWDVELVFKQLRYRYEQSRANPLTALKHNNRSTIGATTNQPHSNQNSLNDKNFVNQQEGK